MNRVVKQYYNNKVTTTKYQGYVNISSHSISPKSLSPTRELSRLINCFYIFTFVYAFSPFLLKWNNYWRAVRSLVGAAFSWVTGDYKKVVCMGWSESVGALVGVLSEGSTLNCLLVNWSWWGMGIQAKDDGGHDWCGCGGGEIGRGGSLLGCWGKVLSWLLIVICCGGVYTRIHLRRNILLWLLICFEPLTDFNNSSSFVPFGGLGAGLILNANIVIYN